MCMKRWITYGLLGLGTIATIVGTNVNSAVVQASVTTTVRVQTSQLQGEIKVPLAQAIEAYQTLFPEATLTYIELDAKLGRYAYKLEGVDSDTQYAIIVDAQTQEVTRKGEVPLELEDRKGVKQQRDALNLTQLATLEEITQLAEYKSPSGKATCWVLAPQSTGTYWTIKVSADTNEYTVKINAQTHEVIEVSAKQ